MSHRDHRTLSIALSRVLRVWCFPLATFLGGRVGPESSCGLTGSWFRLPAVGARAVRAEVQSATIGPTRVGSLPRPRSPSPVGWSPDLLTLQVPANTVGSVPCGSASTPLTYRAA